MGGKNWLKKIDKFLSLFKKDPINTSESGYVGKFTNQLLNTQYNIENENYMVFVGVKKI